MTDDEKLIALTDNELDDGARKNLLARLATDDALRARAEALREARARLVASLDSLLEQAPLARLRASLPPPEAGAGIALGRPSFAWRQLAAGIAIGLIVAGLAAWFGFGFGLREEREDWRAAVVEYMQLYTRDTFALANPDSAIAAKQLQAVSPKIGLDFTPENVAVPGLRYRTAFNLAYRGAALAEIAYTDAEGEPVLFCVTVNGESATSARTVERGKLSYATWSRDGRGLMVVGRMSEGQIADLARPLEARF
jgi:anti-sigma factor RsiW